MEPVRAQFDIFLSHNSADEPAVKTLAHKLKWSVADGRSRTISPLSELTVPQWIENRIKDGDVAGQIAVPTDRIALINPNYSAP